MDDSLINPAPRVRQRIAIQRRSPLNGDLDADSYRVTSQIQLLLFYAFTASTLIHKHSSS